MSIDSSDPTKAFCIECTLHNDSRLIAGLCALAERAALQVGLSEDERQNVTAQTFKACQEVFSRPDLGRNPAALITVFVELVADRFEVKIQSDRNRNPARIASAKFRKALQPTT